jgi:hypothetical protein
MAEKQMTINEMIKFFGAPRQTVYTAVDMAGLERRVNGKYDVEAVRREIILILDRRIEKHYKALTETAALRRAVRLAGREDTDGE